MTALVCPECAEGVEAHGWGEGLAGGVSFLYVQHVAGDAPCFTDEQGPLGIPVVDDATMDAWIAALP